MAYGSVNVPVRSDYLPRSGGTITGTLEVTGGIRSSLTGNVTGDLTGDVTGDVTGNVIGDLKGNVSGNVTGNVKGDVTGNVTGDVKGSATKWNGRTLRLNNNTSDTYLLLLSGNNVDYITKDQLLSSLTTRVATCEQQVKAIGKTTEVLVKTAVSSTYTRDNIYNKTFTLATATSEIAFIKINGTKILRGSNANLTVASDYDEPAGYTRYLVVICTFNTNGSITVTENIAQTSYNITYTKINHTIYYYKYAVQ